MIAKNLIKDWKTWTESKDDEYRRSKKLYNEIRLNQTKNRQKKSKKNAGQDFSLEFLNSGMVKKKNFNGLETKENSKRC